MKQAIKLGRADFTVLVFIPDPASTDGSGKTGLAHTDMTVSYTRLETDNDVVVTDVTSSLNALSALTDAHNDWGWKEVSTTLAPGLYRLDLADAVLNTGIWSAVVYVMITTSAAAASPMEFIAVAYDPLDTVRLGLTALPNAAAEAAGGLYTRGTGAGQINQPANGLIDVNVENWNTTAVPAEHTAGYPIVTVKDGTGTGEIDTASGVVLATDHTGAALATAAAVDAVDNFVDTEITDIQSRLPAALVGGRMDSSVGAMAADVMTAAAAAADLTTELQAGLATAANLATVAGYIDTEITDIQNRLPAALVGGRIDASVGAIAANAITAASMAADAGAEIADAVLDRDMSTGTDSGSSTVRTMRQALRFLRNKWTIVAGTLSVKKEDDATESWTSTVTGTVGANPITSSDPAGP